MATAFALALTPMAAGSATAAPPPAPDALSVAAKAALEALDAAASAPAEEPAPSEPVVPVIGESEVVAAAPVAESGDTATTSGIGSTDVVAEGSEIDPLAEPAVEVDPLAEAMAAVAALVAERGGVDADALIEAWSSTTEQRYRVILAALAQVGDGYRFASSGPDLFDCSGLSKYSWGTVGVKLWHNSSRQIAGAFPRKVEELQTGDLVWRPGHVMLYLGVEQLIVNAVQPGKTVSVRQWGRAYRYGSPIEDPPAAESPEA